MERREVKLKGFFASVTCPSENSLIVKVNVTNLDPNSYFSLIRDLQDELFHLDTLYSDRAQMVRRRSVISKHRRRKVGDESVRERFIEFKPFPSNLINRVQKIRERMYSFLNENGIAISLISSERSKREIFLLPSNRARALIELTERLNREVEELNRIVRSIDMNGVNFILKRYGVEEVKKEFVIRKVVLRMIPIALTTSTIREWIEEEEGIEVVESYLREFQRSLVRDALKAIIERAQKAISTGNVNFKEIGVVREIARGLGILEYADQLMELMQKGEKDRVSILLENL